MLFLAPQVFAGDYKLLVIPDNIITNTSVIDSYIYDSSAEFFAEDIINILNKTDNISCLSVSEIRELYRKDASSILLAKNLTSKFKTTYNIDFVTLKKLAKKTNSRYVLLITSYIDAENYILRRTFWDFLNVPGATVLDPAYKISTFAVLVDVNSNSKLWSDTFYKTISACEHRIITRGPSPQVQQLEKIRDYSRSLCPEIARNVQISMLPSAIYQSEKAQVKSDMSTFDNVLTKKYRKLKKGAKNFSDTRKEEHEKNKQLREQQKAVEESVKLEVEAKPVKDATVDISNKAKSTTEQTKNAVYKTNTTVDDTRKSSTPNEKNIVQPVQNINYYDSSDFDIKKTKKNALFGNTEDNKPTLRNYYN